MTGARRSRSTPRFCDPTSSPPSRFSAFPTRRAEAPARQPPSRGSAGAASSTSATSRRQGGPKRRSSPMSARGRGGICRSPTGETIRAAGGVGALLTIRAGGRLSDRFPPTEPRPSWLTEADLDYYADEFERTGLRGALNRYRNIERDWEDLAAWDGKPIHQPSLF